MRDQGTLDITIPYRAMVKQNQAHGLTAKYRSFAGGWGNGKTSWGCAETTFALTEFPGTNCIVARKTRPELKSTTWDMLVNGDKASPTGWHGIPKPLIKVYNKSDLYIELVNGSRIHGLPLDDPAKIENYNLGFFWIDQAEEIPEDIFLKFQGRLRQRNSPRMGILTWNPSGHGWLWRRFIDPDRKDTWQKLYKAVEATTYDNPNLPDDYLEQFSGLPDAWLRRFVLGSHDVFVGQIFTDWDPDQHLCDPFRIPSDWQRYWCFDPGIRHEAASSWVAFHPNGRDAYYYREHLEPNQTVNYWAGKTLAMETENDWGGPDERIFRRLIGREADQRSQGDGATVRQLFMENGIYTEPADRDPGARISAITNRLRGAAGRIDPATGAIPDVRLKVFRDCEWLPSYLSQYRWKPQRKNFAEEDEPEKPRKKDDHNVDNLGHILLSYVRGPEMEDAGPVLNPEERYHKELLDEAYRQAERGEAMAVGGY